MPIRTPLFHTLPEEPADFCTVVVLGGEPPTSELLRRRLARASYCIAADSGFLALERVEHTPDYLVGDLDSVGRLPATLPCPVDYRPEQDATDFEKALARVPPETDLLEILGGTGRRVDHFLTNLLIAAHLPDTLTVVFHDDLQRIDRIMPGREYVFGTKPGLTISLIPFHFAGEVRCHGVRWELEGADMGPGLQLGQSNIATANEVRISIGSGLLFLVINHV